MPIENTPWSESRLPDGPEASEAESNLGTGIRAVIGVMGAAEHASLAEAIVATVREPLIVLDQTMQVLKASRSFYRTFGAMPQETEGRAFFDLGNGQWNIPILRHRLAEIIPRQTTIEDFEVEHDFPDIGHRTMLLNARRIFSEGNNPASLLIAIGDMTERRQLERATTEVIRQKDLLLEEMNHRVNNSLHLIASILLIKAQTVQSEESRRHLRDAHTRVMAVATVQGHLHPATFGREIVAKTYLTKLCKSLVASMIVDGQPITLKLKVGEGALASEQAVSMGLIATELVINALKHAFPDGRKGKITVRFVSTPKAWRLTVADDGAGFSKSLSDMPARIGLGTSIIEALARQLGGQILTEAASPGRSVSITVPRGD